MRDPLLHFALYPVRNFSRSTQRPFDLAHGPELAEGLSTGGALNTTGIILKSNPAAEQRGIISNGVNSPQKIFLLLPQFARIIPLKLFTPNTDVKSKPKRYSLFIHYYLLTFTKTHSAWEGVRRGEYCNGKRVGSISEALRINDLQIGLRWGAPRFQDRGLMAIRYG